MSEFPKDFAKTPRLSFFFILNLTVILFIFLVLGWQNRQRCVSIINFARTYISRFKKSDQPKEKVIPKSVFQKIQLQEKSNHFVINCSLALNTTQVNELIKKLIEKIKEIDDKCNVNYSISENTVKVEISPILDKNDVKKIIEIIKTISLSI